MTNGDYVYLAAEPFHHRFYGNLTWWHSDSLNEEALRAYQSLLVITSPNDDKNPEQLRLEEEFRRRSAKDFNFTYADDEKQNLFVTACYESIVLFGIVLKELLSSSASANLKDGALTTQHFLNRTFTLATGPITFDEVGERQQPLIIRQFQGSSVWPLTVMALDACAESFRGVREVLWPVPFPPPNEPACGFYGTRDQCRANGGTAFRENRLGLCST
ncbi:hypothetical protein RvY_16478-1 [Ramazzottius varieornatus]|uniref:Receptor ligand binding region domain-containing protein n=1 Tax=Ramazzottius varieornatus TaxID=947166 RepID=A0A1D1VYK8_RAMVA|nr:hypothetical protein RvY_16478-1 [Ramazzottius varieornatus]